MRFERVWPKLLPILLSAFRRRGLGDQAQDLAQQVALRLILNLERIESDEQLKAYALTAARWVMADHWRAFVPAEGDVAALADLESDAPTPSDAVEARESAFHALTRLTPREAEVVERVLQGQTIGDIARAMGITAATVRSLLRFARHRIVSVFMNIDDPGKDSQ